MRRRGQVRLIEAALAGIVAMFLLLVASRVTRIHLILPRGQFLSEEASSIIISLSRRGILCSAIYSEGGSINGATLTSAIDGLIPPDRGYRVIVLRAEDLKVLFSYESAGFNSAKSSASFLVLSGCNGVFETRIVIIAISGD